MTYRHRLQTIEKVLTFLYTKGWLAKKYASKASARRVFRDLYFVNRWLYDTYLVMSASKTALERVQYLRRIRDPEGRLLLTETQAQSIARRPAKSFAMFYKQITQPNPIQKGGDTLPTVFNWLFFPLSQIEQLPVVGPFVTVPLDLMGVFLDNVDILMKIVGPFVPTGLTLATELGSAIPMPGVNTAFAGMSMISTIGSKPLEWMLTHFLDVMNMFLYLSRKEWTLAYMNALEMFPVFAAMMDAAVVQMYMANKYLTKTQPFIDFLNQSSDLVVPMTKEILSNPYKLADPQFMLNQVILPHQDKIPILNRFSAEQLKGWTDVATNVQSQWSQGNWEELASQAANKAVVKANDVISSRIQNAGNGKRSKSGKTKRTSS